MYLDIGAGEGVGVRAGTESFTADGGQSKYIHGAHILTRRSIDSKAPSANVMYVPGCKRASALRRTVRMVLRASRTPLSGSHCHPIRLP